MSNTENYIYVVWSLLWVKYDYVHIWLEEKIMVCTLKY